MWDNCRMLDFAAIFSAAFLATVIMVHLWYWRRRFRMTKAERHKEDEELEKWHEF
jgi:hypothetical protein